MNEIKIGIVIPVLNEVQNLNKLLLSINNQKESGSLNKIVIVAGDDDLTEYELLVNLYKNLQDKFILVQNKRKITPAARNIGMDICASENVDVVQFIDAHSIINDDFISNLTTHICDNPAVDIFNSTLKFTLPENEIERAIQLFTYSRLGRNWSSFLRGDKKGFISGIFAIRMEAIKEIGYFDERFIKNQDIEFVKRALNKGFTARLFLDLIYYYKVRPNIPASLKQMFITGKYISIGFGSAKMKHLAPFLFFSFVLTLFFLYLITGLSFILASLIVIIGIYLSANTLEAGRFLFKKEYSAWILPFLFISSHISYAAGTFYGLYLRVIRKQ